MRTERWILEGEWTGYTSAQRHVVHVQVFKGRPDLRAWLERNRAIRYTDGTSLILRVRDAKPREKVVEVVSYYSLIIDCFRHNVRSVDALPMNPSERAEAASFDHDDGAP
jgi:hypothetical protein